MPSSCSGSAIFTKCFSTMRRRRAACSGSRSPRATRATTRCRWPACRTTRPRATSRVCATKGSRSRSAIRSKSPVEKAREKLCSAAKSVAWSRRAWCSTTTRSIKNAKISWSRSLRAVTSTVFRRSMSRPAVFARPVAAPSSLIGEELLRLLPRELVWSEIPALLPFVSQLKKTRLTVQDAPAKADIAEAAAALALHALQEALPSLPKHVQKRRILRARCLRRRRRHDAT